MALISTNGKYRIAVVTAAIPNIAAPSAATLNAALNPSSLLAALEGFDTTENKIDTALLNSGFDSKAPGTWGFSDNASFVVAEDDADTTILSGLRALATLAATVVIRQNKLYTAAFATGDKVMVLPAFIGRIMPANLGVKNEIVKWRVPIAVSSEPNLDATVAA